MHYTLHEDLTGGWRRQITVMLKTVGHEYEAWTHTHVPQTRARAHDTPVMFFFSSLSTRFFSANSCACVMPV